MWRINQQDAESGCNTLSSPELQEDREDMARDSKKTGNADPECIQTVIFCDSHRRSSLCHIAYEGQESRQFSRCSEDIRRADISASGLCKVNAPGPGDEKAGRDGAQAEGDDEKDNDIQTFLQKLTVYCIPEATDRMRAIQMETSPMS